MLARRHLIHVDDSAVSAALYGTSRTGTVHAFPSSHSFTVQWQRCAAIARAQHERHPVVRSFTFKVAGTNGACARDGVRCSFALSVCISVSRILCTTPASSASLSTSRPTTPETSPRRATCKWNYPRGDGVE